MKIKSIIFAILLVVSAGFYTSCKMDTIGIRNNGSFTDTTAVLKTSTTIPVGFAVDNNFNTNATYKTVVTTQGSSAVIAAALNHGSIVQSNGTFDFTNADALYTPVSAAGLDVYGYNLLWYQKQNASYLKSYAGIVLPPNPELLANPGFEASTSALTNWSTYNAANGATVAADNVAADVHPGGSTVCMKVVNPVANPGSQYKVQVASDLINTTIGANYTVSYWVKAASAGGSIRLSTQPTAQYQGDQTIGTSWAQITWTINAKDAQTRILFDMGQAANTYYIDDASVKIVQAAPPVSAIKAKLDTAMSTYIAATVGHYAGKVKSWAVINEPLANDGSIRTNGNTTVPIGATDYLVWSNYFGKQYGINAFNYAKAADPNALLFIDESGLDVYKSKVDSLISYANFLVAQGCKVDGIGVQMKVNFDYSSSSSSYAVIDRAFQLLGQTNFKIRISSLSVNENPFKKPDLSATDPIAMDGQAQVFKYVLDSYIKNVPAAQRAGVIFGGVDDNTSNVVLDPTTSPVTKSIAPLLFNANFAKKPAFSAVSQSLKGK